MCSRQRLQYNNTDRNTENPANLIRTSKIPILKKLLVMPILTAYRTFYLFYLISTYVGFVPVSNVLAIFVSDWQCEFW
jgi:hypothetical protein